MARSHEPERTCVVCRRKFPKGELERYVRSGQPDSQDGIVPVHDPKHLLPGRGYYVCEQALCREKFPKMAKGLMKKR